MEGPHRSNCLGFCRRAGQYDHLSFETRPQRRCKDHKYHGSPPPTPNGRSNHGLSHLPIQACHGTLCGAGVAFDGLLRRRLLLIHRTLPVRASPDPALIVLLKRRPIPGSFVAGSLVTQYPRRCLLSGRRFRPNKMGTDAIRGDVEKLDPINGVESGKDEVS